jgi:hypothetical protein
MLSKYRTWREIGVTVTVTGGWFLTMWYLGSVGGEYTCIFDRRPYPFGEKIFISLYFPTSCSAMLL